MPEPTPTLDSAVTRAESDAMSVIAEAIRGLPPCSRRLVVAWTIDWYTDTWGREEAQEREPGGDYARAGD